MNLNVACAMAILPALAIIGKPRERHREGLGIAHVAGVCARGDAVLRGELARGLRCTGSIEIDHRDVRAGLRQRLTAGAADPSSAAGHHARAAR